MKKFALIFIMLIGLIGSVSASDKFRKAWGEDKLEAEVTIITMKPKATLDDAYCLVSDSYNHSVYLPVLRSGFIGEICDRDYQLDKGKIHLIFLKNWKMNDDVMQATCIVWFDKNRKNWLYICLEEI